MLQELEPRLNKMDLAEICMFFREDIKSETDILDKFKLFSRSNRIRVHNKELSQLREKFYII